VQDPETKVSILARLRARLLVDGYEKGASDEDKKAAKRAAEGGDLAIGALGSGSDFTPFLQHLGVASLNIGYDGESDEDGVYHSNYDSYDHYVRFGDPGFVYGIAEAQTVGHLVLRFADADVLPMQFAGFSEAVTGYVGELHELADQKRTSARELGKLLDQNAFGLAADPTRRVLPPAREPEVPYLNLAPLDNAAEHLQKSAKAYDEQYTRLEQGQLKLTVAQRKELNDLLRQMEGALTDTRGLPGRDWFKHLIYAPGLYTGYGVKTLPGVREAIEEHQWDQANEYASITAAALGAYCDKLDKAAAILSGPH
jgi:N-acetylated-alpha-linked acidic dipeptidase